MTSTPLVSILINNFNYGRFLRDAIDSALNQTYPRVEVVVVDDGSTDDSREIIASYGDRIRAVLQENSGQGSAFNTGFAASTGEIICFLDSDDIFLPTKVSRVVEEFTSNPNIGWVTHALQITDAALVPTKYFHSAGPSLKLDFRRSMRWGRVRIPYPPTSGQCVTRDCLNRIVPVPKMRICADSYVFRVGSALTSGVHLGDALSQWRGHGSNNFGNQRRRICLIAQAYCETAYDMRDRFPDLAVYTDSLMIKAISLIRFHEGYDAALKHEALQRYLAHCKPWRKSAILAGGAFRTLALRIRKILFHSGTNNSST